MRRRNRKKGISIYVIIGICFLFLFVMGVVYAQVTQTLFLTGTVRVKNQINDNNLSVKIISEEIRIEGETVIRYIYDYKVTNNTENAVTGWKVIMSNLPKSTTEIAEWNHVIAENDIENGILIFEGKEWNYTISAGAEITIHFSFIASELVDTSKFKISIYNGTIDTEEPDPGEETELTALSISPSSKTIKVGEILNLEVTKTPSTATNILTWTSSNEQVATVDANGKVTAIAAGTTTVNVSSGNITATSNITVEENVTPPSSENLTAKFEATNSWASSIQFVITITNSSENSIEGCNFNLGFPEGSTYTIWSNCANDGNNFSYNQSMASNESVKIYGQIDLPEGYLAKDHLNPSITNLQAQ